MLSTVLLATSLAVTGAAPTAAADDARLIVNKLSQKCLTGAFGGSTVTQAGCDSGQDLQRWELLDSTEESHVRIRNLGTGYCLTVHGEENGQVVHGGDCDATARNVWKFQHKGDEWWELRVVSTDKCLDLHADSKADGAVIQQWGCNWGFNDNQTWMLL